MSRKFKNIYFILLTALTIVYLGWRIIFTLPFDAPPGGIAAALILLVTEVAGGVIMVIHFGLLKGQEKERAPKPDREETLNLPDVDVLIPTYGEPLELLSGTISACKKMEYDPGKLHVYVCDDSSREEVRRLAEKLGAEYFSREKNTDAKAGNLNEALRKTNSPFVALFDADMRPRREFLLRTVAYAKKDPKMGFVQTPQHFRNEDLFQPFFGGRKKCVDEQRYFYERIEPASMRINAVILGGSNVLMRREALEEAGGFVTGTLTEDFATGLFIERLGWNSYATGEVLADGLFPETLADLIRQRKRWARGCIQSGRKARLLRSRGLTVLQKLHYLVSVHYWYFPLTRLIYLIMPLLYALFGIPVMKCDPLQMTVLWLPMYVLSVLGLRLYSGGIRTAHRSAFYDFCLMPFLLFPVLAETIGLKKKQFEVTKKAGSKASKAGASESLTARMLPYLVLLALIVWAVVRVIGRMQMNPAYYSLFPLFWLGYHAFLIIQVLCFLVSCSKRKALA